MSEKTRRPISVNFARPLSSILNPKGDLAEPEGMVVNLYIPMNELTKEYCWDESDEFNDAPPNSHFFCHPIADKESLKDAVMKIDERVRFQITHYKRCVIIIEEGEKEAISVHHSVELVTSIYETRFGSGLTCTSLRDALRIK